MSMPKCVACIPPARRADYDYKGSPVCLTCYNDITAPEDEDY